MNQHILSEIFVQLLGFGIVFLVLRHFAWGKILSGIDARRKKIEDAFAEIEKRKKDIDTLEREYRTRLDTIEQEARTKIQEAAAVGLQLSRDIHERARMDAQKMSERAKAEIESDIAKAKVTLRDQIVELSSTMAEKVVGQKLDADGHKRLIEQYVREMEKV